MPGSFNFRTPKGNPVATSEAVYTANVTVTGGREGHAASDDGALNLDLQRPGGPKDATNPEQLFAAGYAACFQSAMAGIGRQQGIDTSNSTILSAVSLIKDGHFYKLGVDFKISIPGVDRAAAEALVEQAHQVCPYSNAMRGNVEVNLEIVD